MSVKNTMKMNEWIKNILAFPLQKVTEICA